MFFYFLPGCLNDCECKEPNRNTCKKRKPNSPYKTCECNDEFIEKIDGSGMCVGMLNPIDNFKKL